MKKWFQASALMAVAAFGLVRAQEAQVVTFNVNTTRDTVDKNPGDGVCLDENGKCSIRASVMEAEGSNVSTRFVARIPAGTYGFSINGIGEGSQAGDLNFGYGMNFTFEGESPESTVIDVNGVDRFASSADAALLTLKNLTVRNGISQQDGGAVSVDNSSGAGKLFVENCHFQNNKAGRNGGAISTRYSSIDIQNSLFEKNEAKSIGGGLFTPYGESRVENVVFKGNIASSGGGFYNSSALGAKKLSFLGNRAFGSGGGLYSPGGQIFLSDSSFVANTAEENAGGAYVSSGSIDRVIFEKNQALSTGGALHIQSGTRNKFHRGKPRSIHEPSSANKLS